MINKNAKADKGSDAQTTNIMAAKTVSSIVRTTLGPKAMLKMMLDPMGGIALTNDGNAILREVDVSHPAAKSMIELSRTQDEEVGDGTTSVVILAAELLKCANELVKKQIHATTIISGYLAAKKAACKFIKNQMAIPLKTLGAEAILNAAKTSMSSKIIGSESKFFANMAVEAVKRVKTTDAKGRLAPVKAITILKARQERAQRARRWLALNCVVSLEIAATIRGAKIALLDFDLRKAKMSFGVQVPSTTRSSTIRARARSPSASAACSSRRAPIVLTGRHRRHGLQGVCQGGRQRAPLQKV